MHTIAIAPSLGLISKNQFRHFLMSYSIAAELAYEKGTGTWSWLDHNQRLRISFDSNWKCFIGKSLGYNNSQQKNYLDQNLDLVNKIRQLAQNNYISYGTLCSSPPGGRFFLAKNGIYRKCENNHREEILFATWNLEEQHIWLPIIEWEFSKIKSKFMVG